MQKINLIKHQAFLITVSIALFIYLLGLEFINPLNQDWLNSGDLSMYQIGWQYFRNDIWRFPLGLNPNFGIYAGGSVVFSDTIPILAIFFKIFNKYLPSTFQYFSIWILLCIYLQLFFSFKIIFKITDDLLYSLIGSLFFCFATIFITRSGIHLSLTAQWLILFGIYIEILETKYKSIIRGFAIILSCTIHFYFTIILTIFNFIIHFFSIINKKKNLYKIFKEIIFTYSLLLLMMYIVGYFSIDAKDGLGGGYGYFNYNLNSFFNPLGINNFSEFNWSFFFPEQKRFDGEYEGFAYLGLAGFIFIFLFFYNFKFKKYKIIFSNNEILLICLVFLSLSVSNNINFGEKNLLQIPMNNLFYGIFSSMRASGRLIWPVYYLIFIFGVIFVYRAFDKKKSIILIIFIFIIQIIDIHPGLLKYRFGNQYIVKNNSQFINDKIWQNLSNEFDEIRLIEPENSSIIFWKMSKYLLNEKFSKTDIFYLARANRKTIPYKKYELKDLFSKRDLKIFDKRLFISDDLNVVKYLYRIYEDKLNFYFKDNLWMISSKPIGKNNLEIDSELLYSIYEFDLNTKNEINFENTENPLPGIGWFQNNNSKGLVADGFHSTIIFKTNVSKCSNDPRINLNIKKYFIDYKIPLKINLFLNEIKKKTILLDDNFQKEIFLSFDCNTEDTFILTFQFENPASLYDLRKGLNRYKRSIILKSISING